MPMEMLRTADVNVKTLFSGCCLGILCLNFTLLYYVHAFLTYANKMLFKNEVCTHTLS